MQAVELLREVTGVEPSEYDRQQAADAAGVKNVAVFLTELSTRQGVPRRSARAAVDHPIRLPRIMCQRQHLQHVPSNASLTCLIYQQGAYHMELEALNRMPSASCSNA